MNKYISLTILAFLCGVLVACLPNKKNISQKDLIEFFATHRVGNSSNYGVIKNGEDYLITVHGYLDNKAVCEELIKPYNSDKTLSVLPGTYQCQKLND